MSEWVKRWGYMLAQTPSRPGIYRLQNGGFLVRGRLTDPRSGKRSTVIKALRGANIQEAQAALDALKNDKRDAMTGNKPQRQLYSDFAISLFQAKVKAGDIKSAKGREKWEGILRVHLLPHFGSFVCDEIRTWHSKMWRNKVAEMIADGYDSSRKTRSGKTLTRRIHLAPGTANTWIGVARTIFSEMTTLLELDRDPGAVLSFFDGSQRPTYTDERPNSLTTDKARAFLEAMHHLFPQHYAMTLLGFATGKRPSTLRPLRARGAEPDVVWDEGLIRFRRSHTRGDEFMGGTKTGTREKVSLPEAVFVALREHLAELAEPKMGSWGKPPLWWRPPMAESELLFPARDGGPRSPSCLDKPFELVSREIGLPFVLTPRAMRRTFNDVARDAKIDDVVTRSITGHLTEKMRLHYSTAQAAEQRQAIGTVIDLIAVKAARKGGAR